MATDAHWANIKESGFLLGMRFLFAVYRHFGATIFRLALYPVLTYYFLINRGARQASQDYLRRLNAFAPDLPITTNLRGSFLHFVSFADCMIDKLGAWADGIDPMHITFDNKPALQAQIDKGQGVVLLASHLGNLEICRCLGTLNPTLRLNILVHTKHAGMFNRLLEQYSGAHALELIQVSDMTPATAMVLNERISRGEFVVIVGDRVSIEHTSLSISQSFLDHKAQFPQGPLILASLLRCPVYTFFCIKENDRYHIYAEHFADQIELPRKHRQAALSEYMAEYVARLEKYCKIAPLQWFNFFPFWQEHEKPAPKATTS